MKTNTGWIVAGVLAVALIIMGVVMWGDWKRETDVGYVLKEGQEDIVRARSDIERECAADKNSAGCQEALDELAELLREFGRDLDYATTTGEEVY